MSPQTHVSRRHLIGTLGVGVSGLLAGCSGTNSFEATAAPARLAPDTVSTAEFSPAGSRSLTVDETVTTDTGEYSLVLESHLRRYTRSLSSLSLSDEINAAALREAQLALLNNAGAATLVLSTPSQRFGGQELNPFSGLNSASAIEQLNEAFLGADIRDVSKVDTHDVTVVGTTTTAHEYEAVVALSPTDEYLASIYATELAHEGDLLLVFAAAPTAASLEASLLTITEAVEHPVDLPPANQTQ